MKIELKTEYNKIISECTFDTDNSFYSFEMTKKILDTEIIVPDFIKNNIWNDNQKTNFISCVIKNIQIPSIVFFRNANGTLEIISGFEQIITMQEFESGEFKYPFGYAGQFDYFKENINNTKINITYIALREPKNEEPVKYDKTSFILYKNM